MEKGMEKGRGDGELLARRAMLGELLEAKFGPVPADLAGKWAAESDPDALRRWVVEAGKADSLATFRTQTGL
jgi:hypothetical protein